MLTKNEPANPCPHGFGFAGQIHHDLALPACKLGGQSWIEAGGVSMSTRCCPECRQYRQTSAFSGVLGCVCDVCAVAAQSAKRGALSCLNSNNCIGNHAAGMKGSKNKQLPKFHERFESEAAKESAKLNVFSTSHKKSATALELNVHQFIQTFGLNHVGFLTLTFADDVQDVKEAGRRFHSLRTNFLSKHFKHCICVYGRTKKGRIHFHLIVNTREDTAWAELCHDCRPWLPKCQPRIAPVLEADTRKRGQIRFRPRRTAAGQNQQQRLVALCRQVHCQAY
ncbi:phasyl DNA replicon arp family protein [Neisseria musculi]|uniref:Phasyl DNA replicon arp family protein n=1 Tax=Neisseria musculi TaxID=1815583 RepID=A0A7H1M8V5_9NEIS|nr:hypothetical protein H7A79_0970 [Neisseria musculi]QNT58070.1 hypothetical protein H7A79_2642 [Neisseria musculi]